MTHSADNGLARSAGQISRNSKGTHLFLGSALAVVKPGNSRNSKQPSDAANCETKSVFTVTSVLYCYSFDSSTVERNSLKFPRNRTRTKPFEIMLLVRKQQSRWHWPHAMAEAQENDWMDDDCCSLLPFRTRGSSHDLNCRLAPTLRFGSSARSSKPLSTLFTFLPVPIRILQREDS